MVKESNGENPVFEVNETNKKILRLTPVIWVGAICQVVLLLLEVKRLFLK